MVAAGLIIREETMDNSDLESALRKVKKLALDVVVEVDRALKDTTTRNWEDIFDRPEEMIKFCRKVEKETTFKGGQFLNSISNRVDNGMLLTKNQTNGLINVYKAARKWK